ncbi:membrane protein [Pseudonocardia sulfidoxydans NBRC 16205]|uniref:Membrane protein n=1 Tax=Pseudonocardia sulfidoxydans NBRC 16205 TaxID=1223511 RepID=A0A511D8Q1_9PSEU|nr:SHOCT domain-containing protein [Pseudonocardia sulfidoxydans]GEL21175.1 membrane protein [Pseudonocardia sulfidoxydans NBRC 16205]
MSILLAQSEYPLLDVFWTVLVLFGCIVWFWLMFQILTDVFRRTDISGWFKSLWAILVLVLPIIGSLIYLAAQGRHMGERHRDDVTAARTAYERDVRRIAGSNGSTGTATGQIAEAKQLLDQGVITEDEFESLKATALGRSFGEHAR